MRGVWSIVAMLLLAVAPVGARGGTATPDPGASPIASPVAFTGCDDLGPYFLAVATMANGNAGYTAVRADPHGVFQADSADAAARVDALDALLVALAAIVPPPEASAWHLAFTDIVTWYRDLAAAPDMAAWQRVVNRDKTLVPALSRAALAGQAACGPDTWQPAYDAAFRRP